MLWWIFSNLLEISERGSSIVCIIFWMSKCARVLYVLKMHIYWQCKRTKSWSKSTRMLLVWQRKEFELSIHSHALQCGCSTVPVPKSIKYIFDFSDEVINSGYRFNTCRYTVVDIERPIISAVYMTKCQKVSLFWVCYFDFE